MKPNCKTNTPIPLPAKETKWTALQWPSNTALYGKQPGTNQAPAPKQTFLYQPPWPGSILSVEWIWNRSHFTPEIFLQLESDFWLSAAVASPSGDQEASCHFIPFDLLHFYHLLLSSAKTNENPISFPQKANMGQSREKRRAADESHSSSPCPITWQQSAIFGSLWTFSHWYTRWEAHVEQSTWQTCTDCTPAWLQNLSPYSRRNNTSTSAVWARNKHLHYGMASNNHKSRFP